MKVKIIEMFNFPPENIFAVITDIPHHVDWMEYPIELTSLTNGPARLGTIWEQNANRLGKKLVTVNTCNMYEANNKFGWKTERPFQAQVTFLLRVNGTGTEVTWIFNSDEVGIVQMAEPLLIKQTSDMIRKSLNGLKTYLQSKASSQELLTR
jgi:hypothetical protein